MKKGISLIVLVITIIVMIIIAGAIIISLSQNNIVDEATTARDDANLANVRAIVVAAWADSAVSAVDETGAHTGKSSLTLAQYQALVTNAKLDPSDYTINVPTNGGCPTVE